MSAAAPADLSAHRTRTNRRPETERECEQWPPPPEFLSMQEPPHRIKLREKSDKD